MVCYVSFLMIGEHLHVFLLLLSLVSTVTVLESPLIILNFQGFSKNWLHCCLCSRYWPHNYSWLNGSKAKPNWLAPLVIFCECLITNARSQTFVFLAAFLAPVGVVASTMCDLTKIQVMELVRGKMFHLMGRMICAGMPAVCLYVSSRCIAGYHKNSRWCVTFRVLTVYSLATRHKNRLLRNFLLIINLSAE